MKDHYATLGLKPEATESQIKAAYRRLAKEFHPDANKTPGAEARFKEINEAHDVLKDPIKKAQWDRDRVGGGAPFQNWANQGFGASGSTVNLDEILRDIRRSRDPFPQDARNRDIVVGYGITLEEAYWGKDAVAKYQLAGKNGEIKFKIPAGIQDGIKLRFQGRGDDAMKNVPPGDLYVKVTVVPHTSFIRMGDNLVTSTTIDFLDALLGAEREITLIEGGKINMRIPAGIHPGQSLRAQGKGMPRGNGIRGDMMIDVNFVPGHLTLDQRDLIQKARDLRVP